jgi:hypothetical protein
MIPPGEVAKASNGVECLIKNECSPDNPGLISPPGDSTGTAVQSSLSQATVAPGGTPATPATNFDNGGSSAWNTNATGAAPVGTSVASHTSTANTSTPSAASVAVSSSSEGNNLSGGAVAGVAIAA